MTDAHGFVREEYIFLDMLDESELDHLFEKEINNMRPEVIDDDTRWAPPHQHHDVTLWLTQRHGCRCAPC